MVKAEKKTVKAKRREPLAWLGTIREGCTEEVLFDLVLEAEEKFYSRRKEGMVFQEEQHVERPYYQPNQVFSQRKRQS